MFASHAFTFLLDLNNNNILFRTVGLHIFIVKSLIISSIRIINYKKI